ncbi:hypothetical protein MPSEU_001023000 [Mayamaea pseudoterrestris]|nr:hypothetical protein MPSEU_001023000 [Mayamaea pseudoterrestris]
MMMTIMLAGPPPSSASSSKKDMIDESNAQAKSSSSISQDHESPPTSPSSSSQRKGLRRRRTSYNPFTNHCIQHGNDSPKQRPFIAQSCLSPSNSFTVRRDEDDLEQVARQLRDELRYTEILELAEEAERAAASGQEYFAGHPSTFLGSSNGDVLNGIPSFRDDTELPNLTSSQRPRLAPRAKTFASQDLERIRKSQSVTALSSRFGRKKLNVLTLRPAGDVFPSFGSFHDHLRTHLSRSKVDERTLVYNPLQPKSSVRLTIANLSLSPSSSREKKPSSVLHDGLGAFSQSFSFDRWVHSSSLSSHEDASDYADDLADHLTNDRYKNRSKCRMRVVEPLPGLELPESYFGSNQLPLQQNDAAPIQQSSIKRLSSRRGGSSRKALLDEMIEDDESYVDETNQSVPMTPLPPCSRKRQELCNSNANGPAAPYSTHNNWENNSMREETLETPTSNEAPVDVGPSFETPAKLRIIRKLDSFEQSPDEVEKILLVGPPQLRNSATPQGSTKESIFIPRNLGLGRPHSESSFDLKLRRSSPIDKCTLSYSPNEIETSMTAPLDSSTLTPPRSPDRTLLTDNSVEIPPTPRTRRKVRTRKVKVLIYGSSPERRESNGSKSSSILQDTQVISMRADQEQCEESLEPVDCSCLSLSPATSIVEETPLTGPVDVSLSKSQSIFHEPVTPSISRPGIRRALSADAVLDKDSTRACSPWNPFFKRALSRSKGYEVALSVMSRFSPSRTSVKDLQISSSENDDFLRNFMYCSKTATELVEEPLAEKDKSAACAANSWLCAPFLPDSDIGQLFRGSQTRATRRTSVSLDRDSTHMAKMEPDSWFEMANEQLDGVMTHLVGSSGRDANPWNLAFEPPVLKASVMPRRPERSSFTFEKGYSEWREEKKIEDGEASRKGNDLIVSPSSQPMDEHVGGDDDVTANLTKSRIPIQSFDQERRRSSVSRKSLADNDDSASIFVNPTF